MNVSDLRNETEKGLKKAWGFRLSRNLTECSQEMNRVFKLLGLIQVSHRADFAEAAFQDSNPKLSDLIAEALILKASVLRSQLRVEDSKRLLSTLERLSAIHGFKLKAVFFREAGLNAFIQGHYFESMERFEQTLALADDLEMTASARLNLLLSIENLGLSTHELRKQVGMASKGIEQQLFSFDQRTLARKGEFKVLIKNDTKRDIQGIDQSRFHRYYFESLPYHIGFSPEPTRALDSERFSHLFQGSYRLRTLIGISHPDDSSAIVSDVIDRIYLWVWRFLTAQDSKTQLHRVVRTLEQLFKERTDWEHELTSEDRRLLELSLMWLTLFDTQSACFLEEMRSQFTSHQSGEFPLFDFEKLLVETLLAYQRKDELKSVDFAHAFKIHPLGKNKELFFSELLHALDRSKSGKDLTQPMKNALSKIQDLLPLKGSNLGDAGAMTIDLVECKIQSKVLKDPIYSEPLAYALKLFSENRTVSFDVFLNRVFKLSHFDSQVHNPKIYNLIARMKSVLPPAFQVKTKQGEITVNGPWSDVHFTNSQEDSVLLRRAEEWKNVLRVGLKSGKAEPKKGLNAVQLYPGREIARQELSNLLGLPKSSGVS